MTAKYPVGSDDQEGIVDAVNYLLSGPAGLGQNYAGFSSNTAAWVRPTTQAPFMLPYDTTLNHAWNFAWPITNITVSGGNPSQFIVVTFTPYGYVFNAPAAPVTLTDPPFQYGDKLLITGVNPSFYDDRYTVIECTTTTVTLAVSRDYTWPAYVSGGTIGRDRIDEATSTDCNAKVTVFGPTDSVFVSTGIDYAYNLISQNPTSPNPNIYQNYGAFDLVFAINRYKGFPTVNPNDNDYLFQNKVTIASQDINVSTNLIPGQISDEFRNSSAVFSIVQPINFLPVLDQPSFGYYWYLLEITCKTVDISIGTIAAVSILSGTKAAASGTYTNVTCPLSEVRSQRPFFDVTTTGSVSEPYTTANTTVTVAFGGRGYKKGDILTIPGNQLGGTTPANDLKILVDQVDGYGNIFIYNFELDQRTIAAQVIKQ
jgi:hypothetical protein